MFVTLCPYGFERESLALVIQCVFRVPLYAYLTWQVYKDHGGAHWWEELTALGMIGGVALSLVNATLVATILLWFSAFVAFTQPIKIVGTRDTKGVEPLVLLVYLGSAVLWLAYGFEFKDNYIKSWAIAYGFVYASGLIAYVWAKGLKRTQKS